MEFSNKALAVLLLAAMVVSLGGTIISINRLSVDTKTGFAITDVGNVSINVQGEISLTLDTYNLINFGACTPSGGVPLVVNSEGGLNTTVACPSFVAGDADSNFSIRNDGNVNINVNITPGNRGEAHGGDFLESASSSSAIAFRSIAGGSAGGNGCVSGLVATYTNFTTANQIRACGNLTAAGVLGPTNDSFTTHIEIVLPHNVPEGEESVLLTFTASNA